MELTGDLSDFALTDILQILALSRKTGTLLLENGLVSGGVIMEEGRLTYAWMRPGMGFGSFLMKKGVVSEELLGELEKVSKEGQGMWTFEGLMVESGLMKRPELEDEIRRYVQEVVSKLILLEKGRFGISLNDVGVSRLFDEVRLEEGLDVGEVLLEAARQRDEFRSGDYQIAAYNRGKSNESDKFNSAKYRKDCNNYEVRDNEYENVSGSIGASFIQTKLSRFMAGRVGYVSRSGESRGEGAFATFCSLLSELRSYSFETEISLMVLRCASEVAPRGVLFGVNGEDLYGLGQFGVGREVGLRGPDAMVREMRIPISGDGVVASVARTGHPYIGSSSDGFWDKYVLSNLTSGGWIDLSVFAFPVCCGGRPKFVIYGDNYPGGEALGRTGELMAFVDQASILLDKIMLERQVIRMDSV